MKEFGGFDGVKGGSERQSLMDPEPLAGVAMPLDIEPVAADPVDMAEDESRAYYLDALDQRMLEAENSSKK